MLPLVDENGHPISESECDLTKGYIVEDVVVRPGAYDTIDNETKFALNDDDYFRARVYRRYTEADYAAMADAERERERDELLNGLPAYIEDSDSALIELYEISEQQSNVIAEQDAAIIELYEMIGA